VEARVKNSDGSAKYTSYDDVSWAITNPTKVASAYHQKLYNDYMKRCNEESDGTCQGGETFRLKMNKNQPSGVYNYTEVSTQTIRRKIMCFGEDINDYVFSDSFNLSTTCTHNHLAKHNLIDNHHSFNPRTQYSYSTVYYYRLVFRKYDNPSLSSISLKIFMKKTRTRKKSNGNKSIPTTTCGRRHPILSVWKINASEVGMPCHVKFGSKLEKYWKNGPVNDCLRLVCMGFEFTKRVRYVLLVMEK